MAPIVARFVKDPDAHLDYVVDWSDWFRDRPGEAIAESTWTAVLVESAPGVTPAEVEVVAHGFQTHATVVWLRGGVDGTIYDLVNRITSSSDPARIDERRVRIVVQD